MFFHSFSVEVRRISIHAPHPRSFRQQLRGKPPRAQRRPFAQRRQVRPESGGDEDARPHRRRRHGVAQAGGFGKKEIKKERKKIIEKKENEREREKGKEKK